MKHTLTLLTILFTVFQIFAQKRAIKIKNHDYDSETDTWRIGYTEEASYNQNDSVSYQLFIHDQFGNKTPSNRYSTTFDFHGNPLNHRVFAGNKETGFSNSVLDASRYEEVNIDGKVTPILKSFVHYVWRSQESKWDTSNYFVNTINASNGNIEESVKELRIGTTTYLSKSINDFDINNRLVKTTYYLWNGTAWAKDYKTNFTYDDGSFVSEDFDYNGNKDSFDTPIRKSIYTYDDNNNVVEQNNFNWSRAASVYSHASIEKYSYDSEGDVINYHLLTSFRASTQTWTTQRKKEYLYSVPAGVTNLSGSNHYFYPNPANQIVHVRGNDIQKVEIYNVDGQKVTAINQQKLKESNYTILCKDLPNGYYFLSIQRANNIPLTERFVICH